MSDIDSFSKSNIFLDDQFIKIAITTFTTVFIAELGDKTQIATLLLSAESGNPFNVFIGATLALISSSLIGVFVGQWLSGIVKPELFNQLAGILMILIAVWIIFDSEIFNNTIQILSN